MDYTRAKATFSLFPTYSADKSSNHKISEDTNLHKTYTNNKHNIFKDLVPSVLPVSKKHIRLGDGVGGRGVGDWEGVDGVKNLFSVPMKSFKSRGFDRPVNRIGPSQDDQHRFTSHFQKN